MILTRTNINSKPITGQMGNQMFAIASIVGISKTLGVDYVFPKWGYCESFKNIINQTDKRIIPTHLIMESKHGFDNTIFERLKKLPPDSIVDIHGYLQDYRYFEGYDVDLLFGMNSAPQISDLVSIHVRRGDYLNFKDHHPCCPIEYYKAAIEHITNLKFGVSQYLVFSDDIEWCKQSFIGEQFIFISRNNDVSEFKMMSKCKINIIANSTFSWLAAYFNHKNKYVISPTNWFGSAYNTFDTTGYKVKSWNYLTQ